MNYNMHVETLDGTIIDIPPTLDIKYPSQMNSFAEGLASGDSNPQVYISVWKHDKGENRKKFYSKECWNVPTFAVEMFEDMCKNHDWYYDYSDDHRVWQKGKVAADLLHRRYNALLKSDVSASIQAIWETYCPKGV